MRFELNPDFNLRQHLRNCGTQTGSEVVQVQGIGVDHDQKEVHDHFRARPLHALMRRNIVLTKRFDCRVDSHIKVLLHLLLLLLLLLLSNARNEIMRKGAQEFRRSRLLCWGKNWIETRTLRERNTYSTKKTYLLFLYLFSCFATSAEHRIQCVPQFWVAYSRTECDLSFSIGQQDEQLQQIWRVK